MERKNKWLNEWISCPKCSTDSGRISNRSTGQMRAVLATIFKSLKTTKDHGCRRRKYASLGTSWGCHFLRQGAGIEKLKPLSPSPHHAGKGPQQSWLLMSQCKSLSWRVYPSLSLHGSHFSFFSCQAHHEWARGETGELFASPPPSGSGRHQPLSLVTEGRERGGEIKRETQGGRRASSFDVPWCLMPGWYLHYWTGSVLSTPSPHGTTPTSSTIASPKVCHRLSSSNPVTNELQSRLAAAP